MAGKTNSSTFRAKLSIFSTSLDEAYRRFWAQPDIATYYPPYLVHLQQIIRASVPLMRSAQRRAAEMSSSDPVSAALCGYFEEHIKEERDHDLWVLEDLESIGVPRADALARVPSPRVATLVGAQYYWIAHHHPLALLSYIALLEVPPSLSILDDLERRTGLPAAAFRTLREHGELDPTHNDDFDRLLDALPLTPQHHELLGISLVHSTSALEDCVRELSPALDRA